MTHRLTIVLTMLMLIATQAFAQTSPIQEHMKKGWSDLASVKLANSLIVNDQILPKLEQMIPELVKQKNPDKKQMDLVADMTYFTLTFDLSGEVMETVYPIYKKHKKAFLASFEDMDSEALPLLMKNIKEFEEAK